MEWWNQSNNLVTDLMYAFYLPIYFSCTYLIEKKSKNKWLWNELKKLEITPYLLTWCNPNLELILEFLQVT